LVVISSPQDDNVVSVDQVHEAMLLVAAAGPAAIEDVAKLLQVADPDEGSRRTSSRSRLIRFSVARSVASQCRLSAHLCGVKTSRTT